MTDKAPELRQPPGKRQVMEMAMTAIDVHRALVFPNCIRKFRKQRNVGSLLELSERLPVITYIRLSKIERGEIFLPAPGNCAISAVLSGSIRPDC
ncbi:hypothetical protein ACFSTD_03750 [Novosphingobium colocasiae]